MIVEGDRAGNAVEGTGLDLLNDRGLIGAACAQDGLADDQRSVIRGSGEGQGNVGAVLGFEVSLELLYDLGFGVSVKVIAVHNLGQQLFVGHEVYNVADAVAAQEGNVHTDGGSAAQDHGSLLAVEGQEHDFRIGGGDLGQLRGEIHVGEAAAFLGGYFHAVLLALLFKGIGQTDGVVVIVAVQDGYLGVALGLGIVGHDHALEGIQEAGAEHRGMVGGDFVAGGGSGYHGDAVLIGALGDYLAVARQHVAQEGDRALGFSQAIVYVLGFGVVAAVVFKDQFKAGVGAGGRQLGVDLVDIELSALLNGDAVLRRAAGQWAGAANDDGLSHSGGGNQQDHHHRNKHREQTSFLHSHNLLKGSAPYGGIRWTI